MLRPIISICLSLLSLTAVSTGQDNFSRLPLNDPFTSFKAPPTREVEIAGQTIAEIKNGDFVHPTFSPNGKVLAYSNVISRPDFENTELLLYNLGTGKHSVLLDSKRAKRYGTYKAFVGGIDWKTQNRIEVEIGDGDVDSTHLIFDPFRRTLLQKRSESFDDIQTQQPMSREQQKAYQQAISKFPSFPREVLEHALTNTALVIPDRGIVLQKDYAGQDANIWFLDLQSKSIRSLINLPEDSPRSFIGGLSFKESIVVLLTHGSSAYFFLHQDGGIKGLGQFKATAFSQIEIKHVSDSRVIFLIKAYAPSERGDNPLFVFDGKQLLRVRDYAELYDVDIDRAGQRIAYCYWEGDKRKIAIRELD